MQAQACNFIKKGTLAQMFSCKFSDISKNTFFKEHLSLVQIYKNFQQSSEDLVVRFASLPF